MGELQRIEDLTAPPIVGQRYLVPTVRYRWDGATSDWPVMGPKHSDAEHLAFDPEHYHLDIRFLSARQRRRCEDQSHRPLEVIAAAVPLQAPIDGALPDPIWRVRLCQRGSHAYPWAYARGDAPASSVFRRLDAAYAGRRCGRNAAGLLVCPHKGFALGSLQPDANGRVVCPLHGLVIDVSAAAVVEHNAMPEVSGGR